MRIAWFSLAVAWTLFLFFVWFDHGYSFVTQNRILLEEQVETERQKNACGFR